MYTVLFFVVLLVVGRIAGSWLEKAHFAKIKQREDTMPPQALSTLPAELEEHTVEKAWLVTGNAVISIDYFKRIVVSILLLFGGRLKSYETLLLRARKEAVLRMREQASGADFIINTRVTTSTIGDAAQQKKQIGSVEALAYGTAVRLKSH